MEELEKEYRDGLLTDKGYKKKRLILELDVVEQEFVNGDLTEKGYQRKKLKIKNDIDAYTACTSSEGTSVPQQLASVASKDDEMAETIMKLFKKPSVPPLSALPIKSKGKSSAKKQHSLKLVSKVVEVVIIPKQTSSIPQGDVRQELHKKGYIKMLQYLKSDSEHSFRGRVHQLFREILSSEDNFQFLSAKTKSLITVTPETFGHTSWNGEAVTVLVGQGSLYLLPKSMSQEVINPTMSSAITTCSSPISLNVVGPVSFTTATTPAPLAKPSVEPSIFPSVQGLSLEDKNLIYQEVEEPHIGGMILEIAGYQQETSHDSPPKPEPGFINLYAVNTEVYQWVSWRKKNRKPLLKPWNRKMLFIEVSSQELDDYLAFRDALRLIETEEEADVILIPVSQLVALFLKDPEHSHFDIYQTTRYGDAYYQFPRQYFRKLAEWVIGYKNEI